jgi:hypothetical protein
MRLSNGKPRPGYAARVLIRVVAAVGLVIVALLLVWQLPIWVDDPAQLRRVGERAGTRSSARTLVIVVVALALAALWIA